MGIFVVIDLSDTPGAQGVHQTVGDGTLVGIVGRRKDSVPPPLHPLREAKVALLTLPHMSRCLGEIVQGLVDRILVVLLSVFLVSGVLFQVIEQHIFAEAVIFLVHPFIEIGAAFGRGRFGGPSVRHVGGIKLISNLGECARRVRFIPTGLLLMTQVSCTGLTSVSIYAVHHAVLVVCSAFRTPSLKDLIRAVRAGDGDTDLVGRASAGAAAHEALAFLIHITVWATVFIRILTTVVRHTLRWRTFGLAALAALILRTVWATVYWRILTTVVVCHTSRWRTFGLAALAALILRTVWATVFIRILTTVVECLTLLWRAWGWAF